jgi:zinc transport system substrate-binding protein
MVTLLALAALLALGAGCSPQATRAPAFAGGETGRLKVATSFYPMYEFTKAVGGDLIDLINLVPAGTEPHDWEPTPGHIKALNQTQVFIYNGAGFEHWIDKTLASLDNQDLLAVETATGAELMQGTGDEGHDHGAEGDGHADSDEHGEETEWDPHVWLDPLFAIRQVELIRDALAQADPAHKAEYEANAAAYVAKLHTLHGEFETGLAQCRQAEFYTSHAAFAYLAHRYDVTQHPIMGLSADGEPTPRELAAIIDEAKEHQVKYIFFETLVSDKVAKLVAREIGAGTLVLNPLEGLTEAEVSAGRNYLSVMRENLANLKTALECGN